MYFPISLLSGSSRTIITIFISYLTFATKYIACKDYLRVNLPPARVQHGTSFSHVVIQINHWSNPEPLVGILGASTQLTVLEEMHILSVNVLVSIQE